MLDQFQRLKHIGNISVASMRRPAKFGRSRSSCAKNIKDFSKPKILPSFRRCFAVVSPSFRRRFAVISPSFGRRFIFFLSFSLVSPSFHPSFKAVFP